jgi:hypothetical protein
MYLMILICILHFALNFYPQTILHNSFKHSTNYRSCFYTALLRFFFFYQQRKSRLSFRHSKFSLTLISQKKKGVQLERRLLANANYFQPNLDGIFHSVNLIVYFKTSSLVMDLLQIDYQNFRISKNHKTGQDRLQTKSNEISFLLVIYLILA